MFNRNQILSFAIILLSGLLSSCATILNNPTQEIRITKGAGVQSVTIDSVQKIVLENRYHVLRSEEPLKLIVQTDSTTKTVEIEPYSSFAYWLNIYNWGIGYWLERNNPKRYSYQKDLYLEVKDTSIEVLHFKPTDKGSFIGVFSLPLLNFYQLETFDGNEGDGGLFGIGLGTEYHYLKNHYLSTNIGITSSLKPLEYAEGPNTISYNVFLNVLNNHIFDTYEVGYGVNVSRIKWSSSYNRDAMPGVAQITGDVTSLSFGPSFNFYKRISETTRLGVLYQPTYFKKNPNWQYDYRYTLSFGITANFNTDL